MTTAVRSVLNETAAIVNAGFIFALDFNEPPRCSLSRPVTVVK